MTAERPTLSRRALLAALLAGLARPARSQGFAGLGQQADGFALPQPGRRPVFPADHGPHPAFRIEWWYLTANLSDAAGRDLGLQWTLFRSALRPEDRPGWHSPQLWMGHAAVTTPTAHFVAEKLARGGVGQAGVTASPFAAWIDDWQMSGPDPDHLNLSVRTADFGYQMTLTAEGPLVLHGQDGYSVKSAAGQASHYYSQPFYRAKGTLFLPDGPAEVTGTAWLDREWSSQPLAGDQTGWDWFSLNFDSGDKLMAFRLRGQRDFTSATWIATDGTPTDIDDGGVTLTPLSTARVAGRDVPVEWRLALPERQLDITALAVNPQSWMQTRFAYWEGPVRVQGSHPGIGYLEMTGY